MDIIQLVEHSIEGTLANVDAVLTDSSEGGEGETAHRNIVETYDADIFRNPHT